MVSIYEYSGTGKTLWEPGQVFSHPYFLTFPRHRGTIFFCFCLFSSLSKLSSLHDWYKGTRRLPCWSLMTFRKYSIGLRWWHRSCSEESPPPTARAIVLSWFHRTDLYVRRHLVRGLPPWRTKTDAMIKCFLEPHSVYLISMVGSCKITVFSTAWNIRRENQPDHTIRHLPTVWKPRHDCAAEMGEMKMPNGKAVRGFLALLISSWPRALHSFSHCTSCHKGFSHGYCLHKCPTYS